MVGLRIAIVICATWCNLFSAVEPASAQQVKWTFAAPAGGSSIQLLDEFANDVSQRTNRELLIQVFPSGQLGTTGEIKAKLQAGLFQVGEIPLGQFEQDERIFGVDAIPFSARNATEARELFDSTRSSIEEALKARGLSILFATPSSAQRLLLGRQLRSASDAKAMTWQARDAATKRFTDALGAKTISVSLAELDAHLLQGKIDTAIVPMAQESKHLMRASRYVCTTIVRIPKNYVLINQTALQQLPAHLQQALRAAADATAAKGWAQWAQADEESRKLMSSSSAQTCDLGSDVQKEFQSISSKLFAEYCPKCTGPVCTYPRAVCAHDKEKCCDKN